MPVSRSQQSKRFVTSSGNAVRKNVGGMAWSSNSFGDIGVTKMMHNSGSSKFTTTNKHTAFFNKNPYGNSRTQPVNNHVQYNSSSAQSNLFSMTSRQSKQSFMSGSGNGVAKLETLIPGSYATVIGVVIAKESPRSIFSKKNSGTERFLLGFVIRDSPTCFVNCTQWGSEHFINDLTKSFSVGDVVKIENAQVQSNASDGSDDKFRVSTPLGFHLTLSEKHSSLTLYNGPDLGSYSTLQLIPTKPSSDYYTLEDVLANGQGLNGEHINLLAAVRKICQPRDITTKTGKHTKRCEIKLFDDGCPSFPLVMWGEELVDYAQTWTPLETVLFISDVRMNYDDFRSGMVATADSKTVFTPNPEIEDAKCLYQFALTQNFSLEDETGGEGQADPPLDQIKDVIVVEQIASREGLTSDYAILYGVITKFDIDAENTDQFLRRKCTKCKQLVKSDTGYQCTNPNCSQGALTMFNITGEVTAGEPELDFSVPISVSDHTGTVQGRLSANILELMTGWKIQDLMQINAEDRTDLKWQYLLERCKFHIKMIKNFQDPERLTIRVLSCTKVDPSDMLQHVRHG